MQLESYFKLLSDNINEDIKRIEDDISQGRAKDFAEYKYYCGMTRGYRLANGLLMEIVEKLNRGEDDDGD